MGSFILILHLATGSIDSAILIAPIDPVLCEQGAANANTATEKAGQTDTIAACVTGDSALNALESNHCEKISEQPFHKTAIQAMFECNK